MPTAAIILAAGSSTRLGRPKQTVILAGETLLVRAVRTASEAGLHPVILILNPNLQTNPPQGCIVVLNHEAEEGIASSIRLGIAQSIAEEATGAVLMTCDQIALTPNHLQTLTADPATITGSAYAGKIGIPAYFPSSSFADLLKLQGDTGARDLLRDARAIPTESLAFDIDTEADLSHARTLFDREK